MSEDDSPNQVEEVIEERGICLICIKHCGTFWDVVACSEFLKDGF